MKPTLDIKSTLRKIERYQPRLNAFLEVLSKEAVAAERRGNKEGSLAGLPLAVKDNICTLEGRTTAASRILEKFRAPYEATVISRAKGAGAIVVGKTNLDEFAMGSSTEYSAFGPVRNPWDLSRVAGGSSGGSAAAVAAGLVPAALGTDTGGSIRQPASFCGVVGVKPTYGRVSRFGVIAYGSSLDQVGPITRTVKDAASWLEVLAGVDPYDATTDPRPVPEYAAACGQGVKGARVGVPREYFADGVDQEVGDTVMAAVRQLKKLGARIKEISLPLTDVVIPTYFLIAKSEASANLARYDGLRYGPLANVESRGLIERYLEARGRNFGPEVKRTILMGTYALSAGYSRAWYQQASRLRTLIRREFDEAFRSVDIIAGPTTPEAAFAIGAKVGDPLAMYMSDLLTAPQNVAGLPAITLPCGFLKTKAASPRAGGERRQLKLPVGLQLTASPFKEEILFSAAYAYEQSQEWYKQQPELVTRNP